MIHKIYTVRKNFIIGCEIIHFLNNNRYKCRRRCRKDCISEYYGAAELPVRCGESHLSGLTEPPHETVINSV